jgi:uncharacterized delta-60 repeat protein
MPEDHSTGDRPGPGLVLFLRIALVVAAGMFFLIAVVVGLWIASRAFQSKPGTPAGANDGDMAEMRSTENSPVAPASTQVGPAGALDETFHRTGRTGEIIDMAVQPDGQILLAGFFDRVEGKRHNSIARFHDDGTLDASFIARANGSVHALALQSDGGVVLVGDFGSVNGLRQKTVARVTATGELDDTFSAGQGGDKEARGVAVQRDGKILVGGNFSRFNGESRRYIVRLNADGSVDPAFRCSAGDTVWQIIEQPDGRLLLRGNFKQINGSAQFGLARLEPDGRIDDSFTPAQRFNDARKIALQPDGKILVASGRGPVVRLHADGSLEQTFEGGFGAGEQVNHVVVDARGRVLVAGQFIECAGWSTRNIVRFNANGSVDKTFQCQHDFDKPVRRVAVALNGDVLAAGNFTERLLRLRGGPP